MKFTNKNKISKYIKALKGILRWPFVCKNWHRGVLSFLGQIPSSEKITYEMRNGLKLSASGSPDDLQVIREVFLHDTYIDSTIDLSRVKTVIDAGAHKGYVAMQLAQLTGEDVAIYCFEPESTNLEYLKINVAQNDYDDKVTIDSSAIAVIDGELPFFISDYTHGHSLKEDHNPSSEKVSVPCMRIGTAMEKYKIGNIDLLKMDIEGTEYEVLFDLDKNVIRSIKYILVEAHETENYILPDMVTFLEHNNFECHIPYIFETTIIALNKNLKIRKHFT
jgi:FkbM family methyltransferase